MTVKTLKDLQKLGTSISALEVDDVVNGVRVREEFFAEVGRSRVRMRLFFDARNVGFVDYVTPFNIFKSSYELYVLEYITTNRFEEPGLKWEADPYPKENEPLSYIATFRELDAALEFFKKHMRRDGKEQNKKNATSKAPLA